MPLRIRQNEQMPQLPNREQDILSFCRAILLKLKDNFTSTWFDLRYFTPPGQIICYHSETPPEGFLYCDGTVYNHTTYPDLGRKLGAQYGGGGVTTFAVPKIPDVLIFSAAGGASQFTYHMIKT
jgi:hypothetical protein